MLTADMAGSIIGGSPSKVTLPGIGNALPGGFGGVAAYSNSGGDTVTVFVEKLPSGLPADALRAAIAMSGSQGTGNLQTVSGIGDAAGKVVGDHDATLAFAKNGTIVVIGANASAQAGSDLESKVESVAGQIAGKL